MGRGKGARCWVGRETPSAKHTPLPQPMLGQASPWAKLCILRLVGSGPARAPSGCREKDFGDWHDALPWGEGRDRSILLFPNDNVLAIKLTNYFLKYHEIQLNSFLLLCNRHL